MTMTLALLAWGIAAAQPPEPQRVTDSDGRTWLASVNRHGAVLRSGRQVIYLGHGCDARSQVHGTGQWGYANGGFVVTLDRRRIGFARQGIDGLTEGGRCVLR